MPQFGAISRPLPVTSMPTMADVGGPKVYRQSLFVPPTTFVATARAATGLLPTPKICMKYVGWTSVTMTSTYFDASVPVECGPVSGGLFTATLMQPTEPPTHPAPPL